MDDPLAHNVTTDARGDALAAFRRIVNRVLDATKASRITLRLDWPEWGLHVDDVAVEARRPGVASLAGRTSIDQRRAATVRWLERELRPLVQDDCSESEHQPPRELVELYGVRAQMLAPLVRDGRLVGWVSVHEIGSTRGWTDDDVETLKRGAAAIDDALRLYGEAVPP
jgi:maleate isomerase